MRIHSIVLLVTSLNNLGRVLSAPSDDIAIARSEVFQNDVLGPHQPLEDRDAGIEVEKRATTLKAKTTSRKGSTTPTTSTSVKATKSSATKAGSAASTSTGLPAGTKDLGHGFRTPTAEEMEQMHPVGGNSTTAKSASPPAEWKNLTNLIRDWPAVNRIESCPSFWGLLSEALAQDSSGDVGVLLPPLARGQSVTSWPRLPNGQRTIWEEWEWPTVLNNREICRVWRFQVSDTRAQRPTLIAIKYGGPCPRDQAGYMSYYAQRQ